MGYKDTDKIQRCPYNNFEECFYESCPFFNSHKEQIKHLIGIDSSNGRYRENYHYETIIHIECKKAQAEIRTSEQNNNVTVSVDNKIATRASIF